MKKFITLSLITITLVTMFLFNGCAQKINNTFKGGRKIRIGVCISSYSDKYRFYLLNEMKNYSRSLKNAEVTFVDSKNDSNIQLSQVESFISQRMDAIIVTPVYTAATKPMTDKAKAAGIPIISVLNAFANQDDAASYILSDYLQAGTMEMEYLAEKMNFKGNVAVIMGPVGDVAQQYRTEACREVIAKYPDMKIVAEQPADWDRAKGTALMQNWLESGKDIDAVVCNNDEMAIGAIKAIEAAGKSGRIKVGGIDATPDALDFLKSGKLTVTVFQDAVKLAQCSLDTAVKAAKDEKVEKTVTLLNDLVVPEEADKYMAKWQKQNSTNQQK
jgi:inositol transport system substrate-binding protein